MTVAGQGSTVITFAAGATNVQTVTAEIIGVGSAIVSATSGVDDLVSNGVTVVGLAPPTAIEEFHAWSLSKQIPGITTGQAVPAWLGDILGIPANEDPTPPTFKLDATATGTPSVVLNASNQTTLDIPPANDPTQSLEQFSVVAVFKDYTAEPASADNQQFYSECGIADHELNGVTYDWGLEINSLGQFAWGTGDPDTTIPYPLVVLGDGLFHVVVGTYDTVAGVRSA